jgi:hypothetical protein
MSTAKQQLQFIPSDRPVLAKIRKQRRLFGCREALQEILNKLPDLTLLLNKDLELIGGNKVLLDILSLTQLTSQLGSRPGEVLDCMGACLGLGKCGTSRKCATCGLMNTIDLSLERGAQIARECTLTLRSGNSYKQVNFLVAALPVHTREYGDFIMVCFRHLSDARLRRELDRSFFQEIVLAAGGLEGVVECALQSDDMEETREFLADLNKAAEMLMERMDKCSQFVLVEKESH